MLGGTQSRKDMKCLLEVSRKRLMKDMRFGLGLGKDRVLEKRNAGLIVMASGNWKQAIPLGQHEVGLSVWQIGGVPAVPVE